MFVAEHEASFVHHEVRFKSAGATQIDIAQAPGPLPVVALARAKSPLTEAENRGCRQNVIAIHLEVEPFNSFNVSPPPEQNRSVHLDGSFRKRTAVQAAAWA